MGISPFTRMPCDFVGCGTEAAEGWAVVANVAIADLAVGIARLD